MRNPTLRRAERPAGMTSHSENDYFTWVSSSVPILVNERTGRSGLSPNGGTWSPALPHQPGTPGLEVAGHGPRSLRCPRHSVPPRITSSDVWPARLGLEPSRPPSREWVRVGLAAAFLHVSTRTLCRWTNQGKIACHRAWWGGHRYFHRQELLRVRARRRV